MQVAPGSEVRLTSCSAGLHSPPDQLTLPAVLTSLDLSRSCSGSQDHRRPLLCGCPRSLPRDPSPASFCPLPLGQSTLTRSKNPCSHLSCTPHCRLQMSPSQPRAPPLATNYHCLLKSTCICKLKSEYTAALLENAPAFPQEVH